MGLSIGKSIRLRRKELRITQSYLADLAEVNINTLYKIERDEANATLGVLTKITDVLGLELKLVVKEINI